MRGVVVQEHDVVGAEFRDKKALHEGSKGEPVDGTFQLHRGNKPLGSKGSDDGMRRRSIPWDTSMQALSLWSPAVAAHQVRVDRALINEDEPGRFGAKCLHQFPMGGSLLWVCLRGREHLLFFA